MTLWEKLGVDVKDINYKLLKPPPKTKDDKYIVLSSHMYQIDLMVMPEYKGYKYIFSVVNMRTKLTDVYPLKTKDSETVLEAFKEIQKRNVVEKEIKQIIADDGSEFKGVFKNYCEKEGINLVYTRVNNHKQNAVIESTNGQYKKYLQRYLAYKDLKSGQQEKYYSNWVDVLYTVRDGINAYRKEHYPKKIDLFSMKFSNKTPKYKINDKVHVKLDYPKDTITESRLHGNYFRFGDVYMSKQLYNITDVIDIPGKNIRYKVESSNGRPVYGSYKENELLKE